MMMIDGCKDCSVWKKVTDWHPQIPRCESAGRFVGCMLEETDGPDLLPNYTATFWTFSAVPSHTATPCKLKKPTPLHYIPSAVAVVAVMVAALVF